MNPAADPKPAVVRSFRIKLLVAMMLVVSALTSLGIYLAQRSAEVDAQTDLQHEFNAELASLHRLQELRSHGHLSCEEEYQKVQDEIPMTPSYYYNPSSRAQSGDLEVNQEVYCRLAGPDADVVLGGDMASLDFRTQLKEIKAPTLILAGRWDRTAIPRFTTEYKSLMPQARFVIFEKSGHLPFIEEPEQHDAVVTEFLKK